MEAQNKYPFSEGQNYWTIEDGQPVWSCWDTESEELYSPDKKYFKTWYEARAAVGDKTPFEVLICDVDGSRGAPMGRHSLGDYPKDGARVYDRLVPMLSGGYDTGGVYWGVGKYRVRVRFTKDLSYVLFYRENENLEFK